MRWARHVAHRGERYMKGFGGETDHLEGRGIDGRIIMRWILSRGGGGGEGLV
jgi:hypothetical protein